jgi:hypothetical protein
LILHILQTDIKAFSRAISCASRLICNRYHLSQVAGA